MKKQLALIIVAILTFIIAPISIYIGSAIAFSKSIEAALKNKDAEFIGNNFNWASIATDVENQTKFLFTTPSSSSLGMIAGASFKTRFLHNIEHYSKIESKNFSNLDEYTLTTTVGSKIKIGRVGFKWIANGIQLTPEEITFGAIEAMRLNFGKTADFNVHAGDIYFGNPLLGCAITNFGDVETVVHSKNRDLSNLNANVAYSRKFTENTQEPFNRIYIFNVQTPLAHQLLIDEQRYNTKDNPSEHIGPLFLCAQMGHIWSY